MLIDPTRRTGELDGVLRPTHAVQLARLTSWTARLIQLAERASWSVHLVQLAPSASWTMGVLLSEIRYPRLCVTFLKGLSCESLSELLRNSI